MFKVRHTGKVTFVPNKSKKLAGDKHELASRKVKHRLSLIKEIGTCWP